MNSRDRWAAVTIAVGLLLVAAGVRAQGGPFRFDYRVSGDRQARPVQVFDDGRRTFFQFPVAAAIPVILAGGGAQPVVPAIEGPYHVVDGVARTFRLRLAAHHARVEATGSGLAVGAEGDAAGRTMVAGYAVPVRGEGGDWAVNSDGHEHTVMFEDRQAIPNRTAAAQLQQWLAARDPAAAYLVTAGRGELAARRQRVVVHALVQHGVRPTRIALLRSDDGVHDAADAITVRQRDGGLPNREPALPGPSDGRPLPNRFDLLLTDRTVADALNRWARRAGYRVDWQSAVQAPVTGEVTLDAATFPEAAAQLIAGLQRAGYPLRLALGADQVARVLPTPP